MKGPVVRTQGTYLVIYQETQKLLECQSIQVHNFYLFQYTQRQNVLWKCEWSRHEFTIHLQRSISHKCSQDTVNLDRWPRGRGLQVLQHGADTTTAIHTTTGTVTESDRVMEMVQPRLGSNLG